MFTPRARRFRPQTGLTLIELLTALAVLAVLLSLAVPSFHGLLQDTRLTARINDLVGDFNTARASAIHRGEQVVVCKSADVETCTNDGTWDQGWVVFVDSDHDRDRDDAEPVLRVGNPEPDGPAITYSAFPTDNYVAYYPAGFTRGNGTFTFCDDRGAAAAKAVIMAKPGRLRVSRTDADGDPLTCS